MRVPDNKIDEIRDSVNILDIIGSVVRLKKSGQNHKGLCPFHNEKTPSFMVNPAKQIYKCFGCGEGGNVFSFIMKDQNITFYEALKQLAEKTGIDIPKIQRDPEERSDLEKYYSINDFATDYFKNNLWESPAGKKALEYLRGRGFRDETLEKFEVGFSFDDWEGLVKSAVKASFNRELLLESGLALRKNPNSSPYDRFRNRIIFPIKNQFGRSVGFGARKFDDSEGPKYVNSPETPVYHKGRMLYGLFQNKEVIRKQDRLILVEGYTDVMALYEYGVHTACASLGTALTPNQARLINRFTKNVILLYDSDSAGIKAAIRGTETLFQSNLDVHVVSLGENSDPDSFLRENSVEIFEQTVKNSKSIIEFYADGFKNTQTTLSYNEKSRRIREMIELISSVQDPLKRELMLKEIGEKLSTDVKTIFKEFYRQRKARSRYSRAPGQEDKAPENIDVEIDPVEKELCYILVNDPEIASRLVKQINRDDLRNAYTIELFDMINNILIETQEYTPSELINASKKDELRNLISDLSINEHSELDKDEKSRLNMVSEDIVRKLAARKYNRDLAMLQEKIKTAEISGENPEELIKLYQEMLVSQQNNAGKLNKSS